MQLRRYDLQLFDTLQQYSVNYEDRIFVRQKTKNLTLVTK